ERAGDRLPRPRRRAHRRALARRRRGPADRGARPAATQLGSRSVKEIRKVGVVGLGTMGAGIAQLCVEAGVEAVGREVSTELGERARDRIAHFLTRKVEKGTLDQAARDAAAGRLSLTTEVADLAGCDLVIEAIVEELAPK